MMESLRGHHPSSDALHTGNKLGFAKVDTGGTTGDKGVAVFTIFLLFSPIF